MLAGMARRGISEGIRVAGAAGLLCAVLGSIHAFSVFIAPLEAAHSASRAAVGATYGGALAALTAMVLAGPLLYARLGRACLPLSGLVAAAGALIASGAGGMPGVWLGYSLIFGAANGLGYGYGLQIAARANPGREGAAMGAVTAAYALGAAAAPPLFARLVEGGGFAPAMQGLAAALLAAAAGAALLMRGAAVSLPRFGPAPSAAEAPTARLWVAYGAGVAAGLMTIGHAAEITREAGAPTAPWAAPAAIAVANMAGSLAGGRAADRLRPSRALAAPPLLAAGALILLASVPALALPALALIGFAYGALIAACPAAIARTWGMAAGPAIYGRVFTAWGAAGLAAPLTAGALFDLTGGYGAALLIAAVLSGVSVAAALGVRATSARGLSAPASRRG